MMVTQNEYANINNQDLAKQQGYKRGLQNVRTQQERKSQYQKELSGSIKGSHQSATQPAKKTDAQTKQILRKKQKKSSSKIQREKNKKKIKSYQSDINKYKRTPWILLYVAVGCNILGGLAVVLFGLGYLLAIPAQLFIDIMLWQAVNGKERTTIRVAVIAVTGLKILISPLPTGLILVFFTQSVAQKKAKVAKIKIKRIQKNTKEDK